MSNAKSAKLEGINKVLRFNSIFFAVGMFLEIFGLFSGHFIMHLGIDPAVAIWLPWVIIGLPKILAMLKGGMGAAITAPLKADYEMVTVDQYGRTISSDGGAQSMQMNFIAKLIMIAVLCVIGGFITIIHVLILSIRYITTSISTKAKSSVVPNGFVIILINVAVIIGSFVLAFVVSKIDSAVTTAKYNAEHGVKTIGGYESKLTKAGNGRIITDYTGKGGDVVIPATIDGLPVVGIGGYLFLNINITSVVIPEGVTDIDGVAFADCEKLASVTLPKSLQRIGDGAFRNCTSLTEVKMPSGQTLKYGNYLSTARPMPKDVFIDNMNSGSSSIQFREEKVHAFKGCTSLSAASKQAIQATGYTGDF